MRWPCVIHNNLPQSPGAKLHEIHEIAVANLASEFCAKLIEYCIEFDKQLDEEHEIGAKLVSYGQTLAIYVEKISYYNPSLIHFDGHLDDRKTPVRLIQHVSQISFLLIPLPKKDPTKPKHPFGFAGHVPKQDSEETRCDDNA